MSKASDFEVATSELRGDGLYAAELMMKSLWLLSQNTARPFQHMNGFVDYQKRGVELPPGCKDPIDVLHRARRTEMHPSAPVATLANLESYISSFVSSPVAFRALWVHPGAASAVAVFYGKHGLRMLVLVDALREQAVRGILTGAGLTPFQNDLLEDNARGLQFRLGSFSGLDMFVRDLLTIGFGVTQGSPLEFRLDERHAA